LARLHQLPCRTAPPFTRYAPDRLASAANALASVRPDIAHLAHDLEHRLERSRPTLHDEPVLLHGDVHLKNAILVDDRVALIDFEDAAIGPPAADLTSLLAELRYQRLVGTIAASDAIAAASAFVAGYGAVRPLPDRTALAWFTAAAMLVDRALGAVHRVRHDGLARLDALLADGLAVLNE
jgi:Ser/Thr protein kinase RdoA (MazF antagonist)